MDTLKPVALIKSIWFEHEGQFKVGEAGCVKITMSRERSESGWPAWFEVYLKIGGGETHLAHATNGAHVERVSYFEPERGE